MNTSHGASTDYTKNVSEFLKRLLPWPAEGEPGYVNLHYKNPSKDTGLPGRPHRDLVSFMNGLEWALSHPKWASDLYFCLSRQRDVGKVINNRAYALRRVENTICLKAIWLDVDVKTPPKGYANVVEALTAVKALCAAEGLPFPTGLVGSGGGLHVYWISNKTLSIKEWAGYAAGLKAAATRFGLRFDASVTIDAVRVLRIPNTFNYKTEPPKPVKLLWLAKEDFDFEKDLGHIRAGEQVRVVLRQRHVAPAPADLAKLEGDKPDPILVIDLSTEEYQREIGTVREELVDPRVPIAGCPYFRDTLKTNGRNHDQGLWMLDGLACVFMQNGREVFHTLSSGHPDYSRAGADDMYDRKEAEKEERGLGWPSCKSFEQYGSKQCARCPHKGKIRSPLNLTAAAPADQAQSGSAGSQSHNPKQAPIGNVSFRDYDRFANPRPSLANAVIAIKELGIRVSYDLFHHRTKVTYNGNSKTIQEGSLTDDTVSAIRSLINNTYEIDCGDANTLAAIKEIALENAYDPVLDMLDSCQGKWDGVKRLDTWVIVYLGCTDTLLHRAIGRIVLIAACRRARDPGCKFDLIVVLEGVEGTNKSTAIRILAGDENFSDQSILGAKDKEVQEQLDGVWMHENADLAGMRRAEVEHVKAFASRQSDRARPAYGRVREDRPRRSVEWGTTNNDQYLLSQTGNRRFGPLKTGKIDTEALTRDREQLLGEAATYESAGESITLDPSLWSDARDAQEQRRVADAWEDLLDRMPDSAKVQDGKYDTRNVTIIHKSGDGYERVASADVLTYLLEVPKAQQTSAHAQRLAHAMSHIGWDRNAGGRVTINGVPVRGYIRRQAEAAAIKDVPRDATGRQHKAATVKQTKPRASPWPGNKPRTW